MYASNIHSYTHLILALGIVKEPTVWGFIASKYPGIHDIGQPTTSIDAKNQTAAWTLPLPSMILGFRVKHTMPYGTMAYHRKFPSTTSI